MHTAFDINMPNYAGRLLVRMNSSSQLQPNKMRRRQRPASDFIQDR